MKKEVMGLRQRIAKLREFISDGKILKFNLLLISNLQAQLSELESEQARDKNKRDAFYKNIKLQNYRQSLLHITPV